MKTTYWHSTLAGRLSRRRALAGSAGALSAAILLSACGRDSSSSSNENKSGLLTTPVDSAAQARRGGTYKFYVTSDGLSFEPFLSLAGSSNHPTMVYSRLVNFKPGRLGRTDGTIEGEAAEAWEFSPDGLQLTFKLK